MASICRNEQLPKDLDIADRVTFRGLVSFGDCDQCGVRSGAFAGDAVTAGGLPRAIVEAIARGLPCIGRSVGGNPELLAPAELVPPNDVQALVAKLQEILPDPSRMLTLSKRDFEVAANSTENISPDRRVEFFASCISEPRAWLMRAAANR